MFSAEPFMAVSITSNLLVPSTMVAMSNKASVTTKKTMRG